MSIVELLASVQFVTDANGNRQAVQLSLTVWEELLVLLESSQKRERALQLLLTWQAVPDDKGTEWWDEFEGELASQRFSLREVEL